MSAYMVQYMSQCSYRSATNWTVLTVKKNCKKLIYNIFYTLKKPKYRNKETE